MPEARSQHCLPNLLGPLDQTYDSILYAQLKRAFFELMRSVKSRSLEMAPCTYVSRVAPGVMFISLTKVQRFMANIRCPILISGGTGRVCSRFGGRHHNIHQQYSARHSSPSSVVANMLNAQRRLLKQKGSVGYVKTTIPIQSKNGRNPHMDAHHKYHSTEASRSKPYLALASSSFSLRKEGSQSHWHSS